MVICVMKQIQVMGATEARNNFFSILEKVLLNDQKYLIKKGNIPMAYIVPPYAVDKEDNGDILKEILKLKKKMKKGGDSVVLLRQMRNE